MASNSISQPFVKCCYQFPLRFLTPCHDGVAGAAERGQASSRVTNVTNLPANTDTNVTEPSAGAALLPEPPGIPWGRAGALLQYPKHRNTMEKLALQCGMS